MGDGQKSASRDLCSVLGVFLTLLFVLPLDFCFSGFSHLPCSFLRQSESSSVWAGQWDDAGQRGRLQGHGSCPCGCAILGNRNCFGGEKGSDGQTPCGTALESSVVCPHGLWGVVSVQNRKVQGQPLLCQLWVSIELWNTGMCSVGEEKCSETHFSQKSPLF